VVRAVEALLAGRYDESERLTAEAEAAGVRAGDRNAELFAGMVRFNAQLERGAFGEMDMAFVEDRIAHSQAGPAYRSSYAWILAALGDTARARAELDAVMASRQAFDANWLSSQAESAEACMLLGAADHAAVLYERLLPYAGRPATAGRAACSFGSVDRHLGGLAALLGREADAERHLRAAAARDEEMGCTVWAERSRAALPVTPR
jgi:hypothetical protein